MVFPSNNYAIAARDFITRMSQSPSTCVRIVNFFICPEDNPTTTTTAKSKPPHGSTELHLAGRMSSGDLHITFFPAAHWPLAKSFWQHTGTGISSRFADHCLRLLHQHADAHKQHQTHAHAAQDAADPIPAKPPIRGRNRHYSKRHAHSASFPSPISNPPNGDGANAEEETATIGYLDERYARNLHQNAAADAKRSLRLRIAGVLVREGGCSNGGSPTAAESKTDVDGCIAVLGPSTRGVPNITEDDVFLFPGGMCAIWHTHQLLLSALGSGKSVCWG